MKKKSTRLKSILLSMVLLTALVSCNGNKEGYSIKGTIATDLFSFDSIFLYDQTAKVIASAPVVKNKFELSGKVETPRKLVLGNIKNEFGTEIILENAPYTFEIKGEKITLKGGEIHDKVMAYANDEAYNKALADYYAAEDNFYNLDENEKDTAKIAALEKDLNEKMHIAIDIQNKHFREILEGDYPTLTKLFALNQSQDWKDYPVEKRLELLAEYEKEIGKHELLIDYRDFLTSEQQTNAAAAAVAVGNPFINIVAQTREKQSIELAEIVKKNQYTLLDFWASWCGPCRAEIPNLKKAYEKYKAKGFEVYAISLDEKEQDWIKALDEEKTPWINVHNTEGFNGKTVTSYAVSGIPSTFLIDNKGIIVASMNELRGDDLEKTLKKLFK